ncbi:hypothetical protein VNI00_015881 [Paramarasmius palmivorus]|uniref:Uncharacterized protein n=1 Tax=Paramarasmius palmivorus TaxID=297713 RepID=A0AAW0BH82_9AGAR
MSTLAQAFSALSADQVAAIVTALQDIAVAAAATADDATSNPVSTNSAVTDNHAANVDSAGVNNNASVDNTTDTGDGVVTNQGTQQVNSPSATNASQHPQGIPSPPLHLVNTVVGAGANPHVVSGSPSGLLCPACGFTVTLPPNDQRWYAVFSGARVGWCRGTIVAQSVTSGVSGNAYQYFGTELQAANAYTARFNDNAVHVIGPVTGVNYPVVPAGEGWLWP